MPELETRFAQIPEWLNYNQPAVPSFLQTREDNRRQAESGRAERALQMREELQPYAIENSRIENETAKAALDYTMQTRAAEARAAAMATQIEKLEGGWGSIEALTLWQNEVLRNPAIANSKVGAMIGQNIGTALQYGKTLEDAKRKLEFEQQRNALEEQRYRLQVEQAQTAASQNRGAYYSEKAKSDQRKQIQDAYAKAASEARLNYATNLKNPSANPQELKRLHDIQLQNLKIERDNKLALLDDPNAAQEDFMQMGEAPAVDEGAEIFSKWRQAIAEMAITGETEGSLQPDGTVKNTWYGDKKPAELLKEVDAKEAAYRAMKSGAAPQTGTRTTPQDPGMGGLPKSTLRFDSNKNLVK